MKAKRLLAIVFCLIIIATSCFTVGAASSGVYNKDEVVPDQWNYFPGKTTVLDSCVNVSDNRWNTVGTQSTFEVYDQTNTSDNYYYSGTDVSSNDKSSIKITIEAGNDSTWNGAKTMAQTSVAARDGLAFCLYLDEATANSIGDDAIFNVAVRVGTSFEDFSTKYEVTIPIHHLKSALSTKAGGSYNPERIIVIPWEAFVWRDPSDTNLDYEQGGWTGDLGLKDNGALITQVEFTTTMKPSSGSSSIYVDNICTYDAVDTELAIEGASLSLQNNFKINFYVLPDSVASYKDVSMRFAFENKYYTKTSCTKTTENGIEYLVYTFDLANEGEEGIGIAPAYLKSAVYATLTGTNTVNGDKENSSAFKYSVADYCYNMLDETANNKVNFHNNDNLKLIFENLLLSTLEYGSASQNYQEINTDDLANSKLETELTSAQKAIYEEGKNHIATLEKTSEEVKALDVFNLKYSVIDNTERAIAKWAGAGVKLESALSLKFMFSLPAGTTLADVQNPSNDYSIRIATDAINSSTGEQLEWTVEGKDCYLYAAANSQGRPVFAFDINFLNASQMGENLYLTVWKDGIYCSNTVRYSAYSYVYEKWNSRYPAPDNLTLRRLSRAMYWYGDSAYDYYELYNSIYNYGYIEPYGVTGNLIEDFEGTNGKTWVAGSDKSTITSGNTEHSSVKQNLTTGKSIKIEWTANKIEWGGAKTDPAIDADIYLNEAGIAFWAFTPNNIDTSKQLYLKLKIREAKNETFEAPVTLQQGAHIYFVPYSEFTCKNKDFTNYNLKTRHATQIEFTRIANPRETLYIDDIMCTVQYKKSPLVLPKVEKTIETFEGTEVSETLSDGTKVTKYSQSNQQWTKQKDDTQYYRSSAVAYGMTPNRSIRIVTPPGWGGFKTYSDSINYAPQGKGIALWAYNDTASSVEFYVCIYAYNENGEFVKYEKPVTLGVGETIVSVPYDDLLSKDGTNFSTVKKNIRQIEFLLANENASVYIDNIVFYTDTAENSIE